MSKIVKLSKPPLTISDQILKIKSKNITISDESDCSLFLARNNYQKLFLYRNLLNPSSATFEDLKNLYLLDFKVKNIVFLALNIIENKIKTELAYFHLLKYGNHGYLNPNNFFNSYYHTQFIKKLFDEINIQKHFMIEAHYDNYDDDPPLYKIIEILSFGQLSKFYSNLTRKDQKAISKNYYSRIDIMILQSWFIFLVEIRNSCAHGSPLINKNILYPPQKLKILTWDHINQKDISILFYVIKEILNDLSTFNMIKNDLLLVLNPYNNNPNINNIITELNSL